MFDVGQAGLRETGESSGLDVSEAIGAYLHKANGDIRLALALSVADTIATTRLVTRGHVALSSLRSLHDHTSSSHRVG